MEWTGEFIKTKSIANLDNRLTMSYHEATKARTVSLYQKESRAAKAIKNQADDREL